MRVLVLDIGGTHVKVYATGHRKPVKIVSGAAMTPKKMVKDVLALIDGWRYDVVSIGYPGPVVRAGLCAIPSTSATVGWASIFKKRLAAASRSSTTPLCKRSAAIVAAPCSFSAWVQAWALLSSLMM